jgi:thymidylate kinase
MPIGSCIESVAEGIATPGGPASGPAAARAPVAGERVAPQILVALAEALERERVSYCRCVCLESDPGADGRVQLLVSRAGMARMARILLELGFKPVQPPPERAIPDALDSCGFDAGSGALVQVQARHRLLLGHELTRNYRLPLEAPILDSAAEAGLFRTPAPELEFITVVLQVLLACSVLDVLFATRRAAPPEEMARWQARVDRARVHAALERHLPQIGADVFDLCAEALREGASRWSRLVARLRVLRCMRSQARRPPALDRLLRCWRRLSLAGRQLREPQRNRLRSGGAIIAVVGGDGSGKSTVVDGLCSWLSSDFDTRNVHLGKPAWSWATAAVRGVLKLGQLAGLYPPEATFRQTLGRKSLVSIGYPWLLREVCRARDRYGLYVGARRFAARGGLVVTDRFPLPEIRVMDGPQARRFLAQPFDGPERALLSPHPEDRLPSTLARLEESYYQRIAPPEVLVVLRVDPEIAVQRRTGEDVVPVRERSLEIWGIDWRHTNAHIVDGGKPKAEVLAEVKSIVWSEL